MILNSLFLRYLGFSQSLPLTSYVKMIDTWMLFTMTAPFLEVALHTCTEVMKRPCVAHLSPNGWVHQVKPADQLYLELPQPRVLPAWVGVVGRLLLPILSLMFTVIFWVIGLAISNWPNTYQHPNMTDCLSIDLG